MNSFYLFYLKVHQDYKKFQITLKGNNRINLILSFIQDWIKKSGTRKKNQAIELRIYSYKQDIQVEINLKKKLKI